MVSAFDPIGLLTLNYSQTVQRTYVPCAFKHQSAYLNLCSCCRMVGQVVSKENVTQAPVIYIRGSAVAEATSGGPFNVTTIKYTVLAIDGNYAGSSNPSGKGILYIILLWLNDKYLNLLPLQDTIFISFKTTLVNYFPQILSSSTHANTSIISIRSECRPHRNAQHNHRPSNSLRWTRATSKQRRSSVHMACLPTTRQLYSSLYTSN